MELTHNLEEHRDVERLKAIAKLAEVAGCESLMVDYYVRPTGGLDFLPPTPGRKRRSFTYKAVMTFSHDYGTGKLLTWQRTEGDLWQLLDKLEARVNQLTP